MPDGFKAFSKRDRQMRLSSRFRLVFSRNTSSVKEHYDQRLDSPYNINKEKRIITQLEEIVLMNHQILRSDK